MGAFRRAAVGIAMTGAAAGLVFPISEGNNSGPNPSVASAGYDLEVARDGFTIADSQRANTISLIGQACADAAYPHTVNQPSAYLDAEDFAAVITTSESEPCGQDLDVVVRKVNMLDDAFDDLNSAAEGLKDAKTEMADARSWKKKDKLDQEIHDAGFVGAVGLAWTGLGVWLAKRKKTLAQEA